MKDNDNVYFLARKKAAIYNERLFLFSGLSMFNVSLMSFMVASDWTLPLISADVYTRDIPIASAKEKGGNLQREAIQQGRGGGTAGSIRINAGRL